jgi:endonuclease/exonuclease/phosphatase family metal-dependent hydrolase
MMQELGGSLQKKVLAGMKDLYPYHATHRNFKLFSTHLMILSKTPLSNIRFIPFEQQTHFESWGITKGLLCADINHNGTTYHLINTHLVASGTKASDTTPKTIRVRTHQINQLKKFIHQHYSNDDIVIVGGDFNSGPFSCTENYNVIIDDLSDCMQQATEIDRITWSPENPLARKSTRRDPHKQLDGFYMKHHHFEQFKDTMHITRRFVEHVQIFYKGSTITTPVSDHFGVEMTIQKNT